METTPAAELKDRASLPAGRPMRRTLERPVRTPEDSGMGRRNSGGIGKTDLKNTLSQGYQSLGKLTSTNPQCKGARDQERRRAGGAGGCKRASSSISHLEV